MKARFLVWLMSTRFYRFLLKYVIPEIQFFHATGPDYSFKESVRTEIKAGDVMLSKSAFHLTNLLIGGQFSHAAIVVAPDKIAEMKANNFDVVTVDEFCKHATRIAVLRLTPWDEKYARKMADTALSFSNRKYDYRFDLGVEALYCSELVYQSDFEQRLKCDLSDLVGMGRPYISPEGIYTAQGLSVILEWKDTF